MKWEQIDANRDSTIEIRKVFNAQRIRILIGATSDDKRIARQITHHKGIEYEQTVAQGSPFVHEIELYGFKSKEFSEKETRQLNDGLF